MSSNFDQRVYRSDVLSGRTVFISGGTSGINLAIAKAMAACGARIAVLGRNAEKAQQAQQIIAAAGAPMALGVTADVRDYPAIERVMGSVTEQMGPLDIVIAGAAGNFIAPAESLSPNGFKAVIEIDLNGTFHVFKAAYALLRRPGASLIAISAGQATRAVWGQVHACAAKAGVESLVRALALEWGPAGVRVNGLSPGAIEGTEGVARLISAEQEAQLKAGMPLRRYGRGDEIGNAAIFLASSAASYVTGTTLLCDGGLAQFKYEGHST